MTSKESVQVASPTTIVGEVSEDAPVEGVVVIVVVEEVEMTMALSAVMVLAEWSQIE